MCKALLVMPGVRHYHTVGQSQLTETEKGQKTVSIVYYRKHNKQKEAILKADSTKGLGCAFCDTSQIEVVGETQHMYIIQNRMPYDLFDGVRVEGHLMVAPKAHRDSLSEFTDIERQEYFEVLATFEAQNYTIYSRGIGNKTRTAHHVHTHLMLLQRDRVKALLYLKTPYLVLHPGRFHKSNKVQG